MRPLFSALVLSLVALGSTASSATPADSFSTAVQTYLNESIVRDPIFADTIGVHTQDDRLPDYTSKGFASNRRWLAGWRHTFAGFSGAALTSDERADRQALLDTIDAQALENATIRPRETDPTLYVGTIGDAAYQLTSREYAPLDARLAHVATRMRLIPSLVRAAEANLQRPPKVFTQLAIDQNAGNIDFYKNDVASMANAATPKTRAAIRAAMPAVLASLADLQRFLGGPLLQRSDGNPRVGARVFDAELKLVDGTDTPRAQLLARAQKDFADTRARMLALALPLDRRFFPGSVHRETGGALIDAVVGEVLDRLANDHPSRETILATAKNDVARLMDFLRRNPVVPLPVPDTLKVVPTPPFKAGIAGAGLDPAGPFTPLAASFFYIDRIPASWPPDRVRSYLRDFNDYEMQILSTHEAVPGHYVQFRYNALTPSLVRRIWPNGSFVEGWAVYTEGMMEDAGYGNGDARLRLFQLKWRLREYANAIIDAEYHTGTLTQDECVNFLMHEAFQERSQALTKWHRLEVSHDQLSSYFVGYDAIMQAQAAQRGVLGSRFSLANFNERLLRMGSVEPRFIAPFVR